MAGCRQSHKSRKVITWRGGGERGCGEGRRNAVKEGVSRGPLLQLQCFILMLMVGTWVFSSSFYTLFDGPEIFQTYLGSHSGSVHDFCDLGQRFQEKLLANLETLACANSLHLGTGRFLCIWGDRMHREQCPQLPTASCMLIVSWYINHMYLVNKTLKIKGKRRETTEIMIEASGFYSKASTLFGGGEGWAAQG